jgi:hypothetical protein
MPITRNWRFKYSYMNGIIIVGPMMCVLLAMVKKIHEGN